MRALAVALAFAAFMGGVTYAALTLVPEIWRVYAIQEQYVPTPALALCIAALRARAAEGE